MNRLQFVQRVAVDGAPWQSWPAGAPPLVSVYAPGRTALTGRLTERRAFPAEVVVGERSVGVAVGRDRQMALSSSWDDVQIDVTNRPDRLLATITDGGGTTCRVVGCATDFREQHVGKLRGRRTTTQQDVDDFLLMWERQAKLFECLLRRGVEPLGTDVRHGV